MDKLDRFKETTEHVLHGLRADENLKHRILTAALNSEAPVRRLPSRRLVAILCFVPVILVLLIGVVGTLHSAEPPTANLRVIPAGVHSLKSPVSLDDAILQTVEEKKMILNEEKETEEENAPDQEASSEFSST